MRLASLIIRLEEQKDVGKTQKRFFALFAAHFASFSMHLPTHAVCLLPPSSGGTKQAMSEGKSRTGLN